MNTIPTIFEESVIGLRPHKISWICRGWTNKIRFSRTFPKKFGEFTVYKYVRYIIIFAVISCQDLKCTIASVQWSKYTHSHVYTKSVIDGSSRGYNRLSLYFNIVTEFQLTYVLYYSNEVIFFLVYYLFNNISTCIFCN